MLDHFVWPDGALAQDLLLLLVGCLAGFCSSAPLGVINLWVSDATLARQEKHLLPFLSGVIVMDVAYAAVAFWGYHTYLQDGPSAAVLGIMGGIFLVVLGFLSLRKGQAETHQDRFVQRQPTPWRDTLLGVFMVFSNPAFLMFWVFVIKVIEDKLGHVIAMDGEITFLTGIVIGDFVWFSLLIALVRRSRSSFQPRLLTKIRAGIAWCFIAFGVWSVYKASTHLGISGTPNPETSFRLF